MFGLTPAHLVIILVIALVVIGPGKLPEVGGAIGKSIREFQKAAGQITEPTQAAQPGQPGQPAQPAQPMAPMAPMPPAQSYYAAQPVYPAAAYPQQPQYAPPAYPAQPQYAAPMYAQQPPQYGVPAYPAQAMPADPPVAAPFASQPAAVATELPVGPKVD